MTKDHSSYLLIPDWPAPANIKACTTTRLGLGVSQPPYDQFNLADRVNDNPLHVKQNRAQLKEALLLPEEPIWLKQTHSNLVLSAQPYNRDQEGDASIASHASQVCAILTADCLPILICQRDGSQVAAIHAGWRGILNGVIENTINALSTNPDELLVWFGPAISQSHYEVGDEMRDSFLAHDPHTASAFTPSPNNRWLANLYQLADFRLRKQGITQIYGGTYCTYSDAARFYSYRRDGAQTGRIASLIWIT